MRKILNIVGMKSDVGIGLLLINVIAMLWYALIHKSDVPSGLVAIVLGIFAGKTVHGVMTNGGDEK